MNNTYPQKRRGRPRKNEADRQDVKQALIRSGLAHLTEYGFTASGIDTILKQVGVPKGSFYYYFDSKEQFGQAVIQHYAEYFANKLDRCLLNEQLPPLKRLEYFVEDAIKGMTRYQFKRGCLVGHLGQEVDALPASYRPQLIAIFAVWQQKVADCLFAAQKQQNIAANADCQQLAEFFWIGWEGAVARAKLIQNEQPLKGYISFFIAGLPR